VISASTVRHPVLTFLAWQAAGLALLFSHIGLAAVLGSAVPSYCLSIPLAALIYIADPLAGFAVWLQFLLYQNLAVSIFSGQLDAAVYQQLLGSSFALTFAMAAAAAWRLWGAEESRRTLVVVLAALATVIAYTAFGAAQSSFGSAAVYFRSTSVAILCLLIGWDVGREHSYREIGVCYLTSMALGVALTLWEATAPLSYYNWVDAADYYRLKYTPPTGRPDMDFRTAEDVVAFVTNVFFNFSDFGLASIRFGGPNMHSISYAYLMTIGALVAASLGIFWYAVMLLPLLFLIGVKGAVVVLGATVFIWIVGRLFGGRVLAVFGAVAGVGYIVSVISYGLAAGDYHVIGLMGGIDGFLRDPLGHGIGVGGNLSSSVTAADLSTSWPEFQRYGADQALESAIGVLLYQMGIGAGVVLYALWIPFRATIAEFRRPAGLIPIALAVCFANGFFQEEAFSPYALALLTVLAGVLSNAVGTVAATAIHVEEHRYAMSG
jgi:hypothetical protein